MQYNRVLNSLEAFTKNLADEESCQLFDARFSYMINRNKDLFYEKLDKVLLSKKREYACGKLMSYEGERSYKTRKQFIVFGWGEMGKLAYRTLKYLKKDIFCVCDNNPSLQGVMEDGTKICDFDYIKENGRDCVIIIAVSKRWMLDIYAQLKRAKFLDENIFITTNEGLYCDIKGQYFDLESYSPQRGKEIFLDAGCYNGTTSKEAYDWGGCRKIYAFEPDQKNIKMCEKTLKSIGCDYELFCMATWSHEAELVFFDNEEAGYASRVSTLGKEKVKADSIDHVLAGRPVTYIKLDVEGSELKTLQGSVQTIKKWHPNMAISIYHKPEDIIEIPMFLTELGMEYMYYIRQYQTRMQETVLYAIYNSL